VDTPKARSCSQQQSLKYIQQKFACKRLHNAYSNRHGFDSLCGVYAVLHQALGCCHIVRSSSYCCTYATTAKLCDMHLPVICYKNCCGHAEELPSPPTKAARPAKVLCAGETCCLSCTISSMTFRADSIRYPGYRQFKRVQNWSSYKMAALLPQSTRTSSAESSDSWVTPF